MKYLGSFLIGGLSSLSLAPNNYYFLIFLLAIPFYNASIQKKLINTITIIGLTSFGWFFTSLYWIGNALTIGPSWQLFLIPLAIIFIPIFMSVYWILASIFSFIFFKKLEARFLGIINFIGIFEICRSKFFTGFPWNAPGQIFVANEMLIQIYSIIGQNGANFLALNLASIPLFIMRKNIKSLVFVCIPFILFFIFGNLRTIGLPQLNNAEDFEKKIRIIQPNISQKEKWNISLRNKHFQTISNQSLIDLPIPILTVLPETAIAGFWPIDKNLIEEISKKIIPQNGHLLTGILRLENKNKYNSAFLFNKNADLIDYYDKVTLVPFGEYNPLKKMSIINILNNMQGFTKGMRRPLIDIPKIGKIKLLICYEIIFPNYLVNDNEKPSLIINITNDGWFGESSGPYQHFEQARIRAVEEGVPIFRSANTGISGGIDPYGRIIKKTQLSKKEHIDLFIPNALPSTIYSSFRWFGVCFMFFWLLILSIWIDMSYKFNK